MNLWFAKVMLILIRERQIFIFDVLLKKDTNLNSLSAASRCVSSIRGCKECTNVNRACKKQRFCEEKWIYFQKISVLTRPSFEFVLVLRYNFSKLGVLFFLMPIFKSIPGLNGLMLLRYLKVFRYFFNPIFF